MRKIKKRFVLILLLVGALLSGCAGKDRDHFAYLQTDFRATLAGEMNGLAFEANVAVENCGTAMRGSITYTAPETLAGWTVISAFDADGEPVGDAALTASFGALGRTNAEAVGGYLSPLSALLSRKAPLGVQGEGTKTRLSLPNDAVFVLNADGIPQNYESKALAFEITEWKTDIR